MPSIISNFVILITSRYAHLTNYSVNKYNANFLTNTDADDDGFGSKWSLIALRKRLTSLGINHEPVWAKIEDIVIKTVLAAEPIMFNSFENVVPFRTNCFEMLGFDVLIDNNMEPWLLEVNLSPSLGCDSPLDQKIKSSVISDIFSLAGKNENLKAFRCRKNGSKTRNIQRRKEAKCNLWSIRSIIINQIQASKRCQETTKQDIRIEKQ
jgi:hypothetical protein